MHMLLIFHYSAQIVLENAFFCRQNARPKHCLSARMSKSRAEPGQHFRLSDVNDALMAEETASHTTIYLYKAIRRLKRIFGKRFIPSTTKTNHKLIFVLPFRSHGKRLVV